MLSPYLLPIEVRLPARTVRRRIMLGQWPTLHLTARLRLIERRALYPEEADPTDVLPETLSAEDLCWLLRLSPRALDRLIARQVIPTPPTPRVAMIRWIIDHTTDSDHVIPRLEAPCPVTSPTVHGPR